MNAAGVLGALEEDLHAEVEHWHPWMLVARFATAFVPLFVGLLASRGWSLSWGQLWALLPGVLAAAAERVWRSAPWGALLEVVRDAQDASRRSSVPPPAVVTPTVRIPGG